MTQLPEQHDPQMERILDALGERERSMPDAGFEARLAATAVEAARQAPGPKPLGGAGYFQQGWLRIAAVIAVMGGVGVGTLLMRSGGAGTGAQGSGVVANADEIGSELDAWMEEVESTDALTLSGSDEVALPVGWGELEIDFWGQNDPLFGTVESF